MVDAYIRGNVDRISPEAPVPVVNVKDRESRLGGAANVALNVKSMGASPVLVSIMGNDEAGHEFLDLLVNADIENQGILLSDDRKTTVKTRVMSGNQQLLRYDEEDTHSLSDIDRKTLLEHITKLLATCDLVIFEDYDKGTLDANLIGNVLEEANRQGKFVAVDPKRKNFFDYKNVDLFKPNLRELSEALEVSIDGHDLDSLREATRLLKEKIHFKNALITLSSAGVFCCGDEKKQLSAQFRNISDVSGAGDTVIAVAALSMVAGLSLFQAGALANMAGGIVCESAGVVPIELEKLKSELSKLL